MGEVVDLESYRRARRDKHDADKRRRRVKHLPPAPSRDGPPATKTSTDDKPDGTPPRRDESDTKP